MKTIKTERVFFNRFNVVLAVGTMDANTPGYYHAKDMSIVEGEVEVGMPADAILSGVRKATQENASEEKEAKEKVTRELLQQKKDKQLANAKAKIIAAIRERKCQLGTAYYEAEWRDVLNVEVKTPTWTQAVRVSVELDGWKRPCVEVGRYGDDIHRYPLNKKGEFNYDKIAECIVSDARSHHLAAVSKAERDSKVAQSSSIVRRLSDEYGIGSYATAVAVEPTTYSGEKVIVRIQLELDAEQAGELLAVAKRIQAERDAKHEVAKLLEQHAGEVATAELNS
jgi:hypothetical protein